LQLAQATRIRFLRMISVLQDWKDPDLRRVCEATDAKDYLPGDTVTEKNSDAEAAHVLMRGGLQVHNSGEQGNSGMATGASLRARTSFVKMLSTPVPEPLTVLDEHCLFEKGNQVKSRCTVVALECSEMLRVDRHIFQEVLRARRARKTTDGLDTGRARTVQQAASESGEGSDGDPINEDLGGVRGTTTNMVRESKSDDLRQQQQQHNAASAAVSAG